LLLRVVLAHRHVPKQWLGIKAFHQS
jgi:hypothetical protein